MSVGARCKLPPLLGLSVLLVIGALPACGSSEMAKPQCSMDPDCGPDAACMMGTCLPRGMDRTVACEILPRTDSTSAPTGIASVILGPDPIALVADDRVLIEGTVTGAPDSRVVLSALGPIPGQGDLQFGTELAGSNFQIGLGRSFLSQVATIWLLPSAKSQEHPPVTFTARLDPALKLMFPGTAEMATVRAILHDSLDLPPAPHLARAYVGTQAVSNTAMTDDTGLFQLLIAPGAMSPDAGGMITVEFTPADSADSGFRFITRSFAVASAAGGSKPRTFRMPAFGTPAPLRFTVVEGANMPNAGAGTGTGTGTKVIPDVSVRFRTEIVAPLDGVTIYEQERRTDGLGQVEVPLIPGTATDPRMYQITVLPRLDSPYAGRCVPQHPVTIVGNADEPRYSTAFSLDRKVTLEGTIVGADASPAAGARVTATVVRENALCKNPVSTSPVSNTTNLNGKYTMLVDPGTYRLDIDPLTGAPLPRLTLDGAQSIAVPNDATHDIVLPAGEVVYGRVLGPDGLPVVSAGIKIFQVLCEGDTCLGPGRIPPALRSEALTDTDGFFRAVLPLP